MVTAFGVSDPYVQVEGVLQGGGLDPLFYVMAMHTLHLAIKQSGLGVPLVTTDGVEAVGSLGYVDDTAAMAADRPAAQELAEGIRAVFRRTGTEESQWQDGGPESHHVPRRGSVFQKGLNSVGGRCRQSSGQVQTCQVSGGQCESSWGFHLFEKDGSEVVRSDHC